MTIVRWEPFTKLDSMGERWMRRAFEITQTPAGLLPCSHAAGKEVEDAVDVDDARVEDRPVPVNRAGFDNWGVTQMPHDDDSGRTRRHRPIRTPRLPNWYTRYRTIEVTPR